MSRIFIHPRAFKSEGRGVPHTLLQNLTVCLCLVIVYAGYNMKLLLWKPAKSLANAYLANRQVTETARSRLFSGFSFLYYVDNKKVCVLSRSTSARPCGECSFFCCWLPSVCVSSIMKWSTSSPDYMLMWTSLPVSECINPVTFSVLFCFFEPDWNFPINMNQFLENECKTT